VDTFFLAVYVCHNIMFLHVVTQWICFGLVLSYNGIVWFGVVTQLNCLVWCCRTIELFDLVLSYNGIFWFNSYKL